MNRKYAHVFPAMVTPFNEDGTFNIETAKKHADWMIDNGIGGIGVLMAAGEYQSVTLEQHKAYCREMIPYIKSRGASVIVGCSRERVEDVLELMQNAYEAGGDAAMVLPAFYYTPDQNEIYLHYKYLNDHFKQIHKFFGLKRHHAGVRGVDIGNELLEEVKNLGVDVSLNTVAYGFYPNDEGVALIVDGKKGEIVHPQKIIMATGASENPLAFPGWTLPEWRGLAPFKR
ncbi:dihydrodipicolinate synthase family protein [Pseudoramibacter faecis]|uniref:dihydrodipicolinate synthase family protein n=1 Tax=Pseudoramibacter faecis TaxID=3108534 RepID=UPI002E794C08|nr:dihydrodipicolinate synthase family protein [Pseudoramibacter sp. HA2172]